MIVTFSLTNGFTAGQHLDLLWQMKDSAPSQYEAIEWLQDNVEGTPVIVERTPLISEGVGGTHKTVRGHPRVSAFTGLPTVLGSPNHEAAWRGSYEPQAGRRENVERLYTTTNIAEAKTILEKYRVEYVYVGGPEHGTYGGAGLSKFATFMEIVFHNDGVTIYKMRTQED